VSVYETKATKRRTVVSSCSGSRLDCLTLKIKAPTMLRNVGNHSPHDRASHYVRLESWAAPLSELQISHPSHFRVKQVSEVIHAAVSRRKPKPVNCGTVIGGNCTVFNYIEYIPAKRRQSFWSSGWAGSKAVITCYFWIHIHPFSR